VAIAPAGGPSSLVQIPPRMPSIDATGATAMEQDDGGVLFDFDPPKAPQVDVTEHSANLAEGMSEDDLSSLAEGLLEGIAADLASRKGWEDLYVKGIKLLGLRLDGKKDPLPFEGACDSTHPLLLRSLINFQSDSSGELLPAEGPVKADIVDDAGEELEELADRVVAGFNFFLTETDEDYYPEFNRMLFYLGLGGNGFKKVYDCPLRGRPASDFILADDLIVSFTAQSLKRAPRVTHRTYPTRSEMRRYQIMGYFLDIELQQPVYEPTAMQKAITGIEARGRSIKDNEDEPYTVYEVRCERTPDKIVPEPGAPERLPLPYVVTIEKDSRKVLRVERNWKQGDKRYHQRTVPGIVKYGMFPGLGFYDYGLAHLVGDITRIATMLTREIVDSGQFANFQGGMLAKGAKVEKNVLRPAPGEWVQVDTGGLKITEAVMPFPYHEPSQMLALMLDKIVSEGEKLAGTAAMNVAEGRQDAPVGTTLALIEQAMKPTTAVNKRLHTSQKQEFKLLRELFSRNPDSVWGYRTRAGKDKASGADFARIDVIPVSDPNVPSSTQRIMRSEALGGMGKENPDLFDRRKLIIRRMKSLGIADGEGLLVPPPQAAQPMDPASENIAVLQGMPLAADIHQDHQSHISAHATLLMSPAAAAAPQMVPMLSAHIVEHFALYYRQQVEAAIGQPLPPPGQPLPPQVEMQLSQAIAAVTEHMHEEMAKIAVGPFGADPAMVKMMEQQVKMAAVQQAAQKTEAAGRSAEIDNRVQLATAQADQVKHGQDMQNAHHDRMVQVREQNVKLLSLASAERVAKINAAAQEAQAEAALKQAHADAEVARIKGESDVKAAHAKGDMAVKVAKAKPKPKPAAKAKK
jgi:hypothetical protein